MIHVAIIGAGIGAQHFDALQALMHDFRVTHVVDTDLNRAEDLVHGTTTSAVEHFENVLQDPNVDLIDICLPPHLHVEYTLKSLAAGKHVVCEKPLATSLTGAKAVQRAAETHEKRVFPVFQYRWGQAILQLRQLMDAGLTGKPQVAAVETHWSRGADYYAVPWRGTWQGEAGGAVLGHAIHTHDLLSHIMGRVQSVSAMTATLANPIETEDSAAITFEFEDGAIATSSVSLGAATNETRLRFVFEHLTATSGTAPYAPGSDPWRFDLRTPDMNEAVQDVLQNASKGSFGYAGYFAEIARALKGQQHHAVSLEDGVKSIELVTAIYDAARQRKRVFLPLPDNHELQNGWAP